MVLCTGIPHHQVLSTVIRLQYLLLLPEIHTWAPWQALCWCLQDTMHAEGPTLRNKQPHCSSQAAYTAHDRCSNPSNCRDGVFESLQVDPEASSLKRGSCHIHISGDQGHNSAGKAARRCPSAPDWHCYAEDQSRCCFGACSGGITRVQPQQEGACDTCVQKDLVFLGWLDADALREEVRVRQRRMLQVRCLLSQS